MVRIDGLKLVFDDGSWVCYRLSGTEPVVRVYSEARSEQGLEKLSVAAKQWIFELKRFSRIGKKLGRLPSAEDGLRVVAEKAPQAEALAASWIERSRPVWAPVYALRRRIATVPLPGWPACCLCM